MTSNGGGGFKLGFGVSVSTGVFLVFALGGVAAAILGHKHGQRNAIKNSWGPGGNYDHISGLAHAYAGNAPIADDVDENQVMTTIVNDIQKDASNKHQFVQNIDRIIDVIHSYQISIKGLVKERRKGQITQADYIGKIGELEKQIVTDLGLGVEPAPQVVNPHPAAIHSQLDNQGRTMNFFRPPRPSVNTGVPSFREGGNDDARTNHTSIDIDTPSTGFSPPGLAGTGFSPPGLHQPQNAEQLADWLASHSQ
jgi:hypothetical protein